MKTRALLLILFLAGADLMSSSGLPAPNRGTQLFLLIRWRLPGMLVVGMTPAKRPVLQTWNRYNSTYDFVSAVVQRTANGSRVSFTRYVMADDYIPRVEHLDLPFRYNEQPRYRFFDIGSIIGFYRNSVKDIDPREFMQEGAHLTNR